VIEREAALPLAAKSLPSCETSSSDGIIKPMGFLDQIVIIEAKRREFLLECGVRQARAGVNIPNIGASPSRSRGEIVDEEGDVLTRSLINGNGKTVAETQIVSSDSAP
jgi:hypothetical protein